MITNTISIEKKGWETINDDTEYVMFGIFPESLFCKQNKLLILTPIFQFGKKRNL